MKKLLLPILLLLLSGCIGPEKFDASSEEAIKKSTQTIVKELPASKAEEFQKALMYFSIGGESGLKSMLGAAFSRKSSGIPAEAMLTVNLKSIDGLTGEQILGKYRSSLEANRVKREIEEVERQKVRTLKKEAEALLKSNKFEDALAKYKAMSEIALGVEAAEVGIEETTKEMEEFTEKMSYLEKLSITEFVAKRIDTYSKKGVPAVRISLKNNGDRSLDEVKVVVYFQDKDGKTIFEEDYHPVLVNGYSFGGNNKPHKYYIVDSALSDWQEGKAVAKIVDIEFTK